VFGCLGRPVPSLRTLWLLGRAIGAVILVRTALWLLPARVVLRSVDRVVERWPVKATPAVRAIRRVVWAVQVASRRVPGASCLTQALAAKLLLARWGVPSQLRIGVARGEQGNFQAHAWLEAVGQVVIGDVGLERYVRLPSLGPALQ
jgi:Transglutaminase-like superfamily